MSALGLVCLRTHHKEHLPLVLVRQQEEPQDGGVRDLIVKRLTVQVQEGGVDTDIIPERQTLTQSNTSHVHHCKKNASLRFIIYVHLYENYLNCIQKILFECNCYII